MGAAMTKPKQPRFIKISADFKPLPANAKDWVAVVCTAYRTANGLPLMFTARDLGAHPLEKTSSVAEACDLFGFKDWYCADATETTFMLDRSKSPAMPAEFFIGETGWQWTSEEVASDSSIAFGVDLFDGGVYWGYRNGCGLVRACREVSFGECLELYNWAL